MKTTKANPYNAGTHSDTSSNSDDVRQENATKELFENSQNVAFETSGDTYIPEHILNFMKASKEDREFPIVSFDQLIKKLSSKSSTKQQDELLTDIRTLESLDEDNYIEDESELDEELTTISWLKVPSPGAHTNIKAEVYIESDDSLDLQLEDTTEEVGTSNNSEYNSKEPIQPNLEVVNAGASKDPNNTMTRIITQSESEKLVKEVLDVGETVEAMRDDVSIFDSTSDEDIQDDVIPLQVGIESCDDLSLILSSDEDVEVEDSGNDVGAFEVDLELKDDAVKTCDDDVAPHNGEIVILEEAQPAADVVDIENDTLEQDSEGSIIRKHSRKKSKEKSYRRILEISSSSEEEGVRIDSIMKPPYESSLHEEKSGDSSHAEDIELLLDVCPQQKQVSSSGTFVTATESAWPSQGSQEPLSSSSQADPQLDSMYRILESKMATLEQCSICGTAKNGHDTCSKCGKLKANDIRLVSSPRSSMSSDSIVELSPEALGHSGKVHGKEADVSGRTRGWPKEAQVESEDSEGSNKNSESEYETPPDQEMSDLDEQALKKSKQRRKRQLAKPHRSVSKVPALKLNSSASDLFQSPSKTDDSDVESVRESPRKKGQPPAALRLIKSPPKATDSDVESGKGSPRKKGKLPTSSSLLKSPPKAADSDVESDRESPRKRGRPPKSPKSSNIVPSPPKFQDSDVESVTGTQRKRSRPQISSNLNTPEQQSRQSLETGSKTRSLLMIGPRSSRKSLSPTKLAQSQQSECSTSQQDIIDDFRLRIQPPECCVDQLLSQTCVKLTLLPESSIHSIMLSQTESPKKRGSKRNRERSKSSKKVVEPSTSLNATNLHQSENECIDELLTSQKHLDLSLSKKESIHVPPISIVMEESISQVVLGSTTPPPNVKPTKSFDSKKPRKADESEKERLQLPSTHKKARDAVRKVEPLKDIMSDSSLDSIPLNQILNARKPKDSKQTTVDVSDSENDVRQGPNKKKDTQQKTKNDNQRSSSKLRRNDVKDEADERSTNIKVTALLSDTALVSSLSFDLITSKNTPQQSKRSRKEGEHKRGRVQQSPTTKKCRLQDSKSKPSTISKGRPTNHDSKQTNEISDSEVGEDEQPTKKQGIGKLNPENDQQCSKKLERELLKKKPSDLPPKGNESTKLTSKSLPGNAASISRKRGYHSKQSREVTETEDDRVQLSPANKKPREPMSDSSFDSNSSRFSLCEPTVKEPAKSKKKPTSKIDDLSDSSLYVTPISQSPKKHVDEYLMVEIKVGYKRKKGFPKKKLKLCVDKLFQSSSESSPSKSQLLNPPSVVINRM